MANRNSKGQFVKGHVSYKQGGRAKRSVEDKYLKALRDSVTTKDWKDICNKAIEQSKSGDKAARQWLSDYLLGRPVQSLVVEGQTDLTIILAWDDAESESDAAEAA